MMDCEFTYNYRDKSFELVTSSEHRAIGTCLSHEFGRSPAEHEVLHKLVSLLETEQVNRFELDEWVIEVELVDVCVKHNSVCVDEAEIEEPDVDSYLDWELTAKCSKDDLAYVISSWLSFVNEQKG